MTDNVGIAELKDDEQENDLSSQQSTNEECESANMEEEQELEIIEPVKKISKQQIDFPLLRKLKNPSKRLLPIPLNYQFDDLKQYMQTMFRLEDENYFKQFRCALKYHISQNFQDSETARLGFCVFSNFQIEKSSYEQDGLILSVISSMNIPRYQQERAQIMNNQIIFFVSLDSQRIFVGKTIVENKLNKSEDGEDESDIEDDESLENTQKTQYEEEEDDDEVEQIDQFERIEFRQTFKIKMNTLDNLDEFLIKLDDIHSKFKLVTPSDYWHSLEKSLNCQLQFKHLDNIAFPLQTLKGEKGLSSFPKYAFLQNDREVEYFKNILEFEISKENELDNCQQVALRHALFNENAIIQGPPGTGKTFLASKIVNLFRNVHNKYTHKPIIVISQKNISLDQLLLRIYNQNKHIKILRLGFCKVSQEMKKFTLNAQGGPQFRYPNSSQQTAKQIDKSLWDCIEYIKKRKDKSRFQLEKEIKFPESIQNSIKQKLIYLLRSELNLSDTDCIFEDEIKDKIISKWMKGKLSFEKLLNFLIKAGVDLTGEQKEYLQKSIDLQQSIQEFQLSANEKSISQFLKKITQFEQLSVQFSQFLLKNQEAIEIDIIQNKMRNNDSSRRNAFMKSNQGYQHDLSQFMEDFDVIGMTFTGYHTNFEAIQQLGAEIVVVEEASEVIESNFYPVLTPNVKHLIQIGDHYQLRPLVKCESLKHNYNYKMSYFERLISVNKLEHVTLYQQRRMVPQFANFTRIFYGNKYSDAPNTKALQFQKTISKNGMYMLQHSYPDQIQLDNSYVNTFEAAYVNQIVNYLLRPQKISQKQISVLATYKSQKILIESLLSKNKSTKNVKVYTVDQFQGNENDIVILSCVRSNIDKKCGFVMNDHRINVAFSRAKTGFFCIGNFNQYSEKSQTWEKIKQLSQQQFSLGAVGVEAQYKNLSVKALKHESYLLQNQEKSQKICSMCSQKSHIINCKFRQEKNTAFSMIKYQQKQN
ncbi:hypothetical protein ABPG72_014346 [Tetrahymena utriculariae]